MRSSRSSLLSLLILLVLASSGGADPPNGEAYIYGRISLWAQRWASGKVYVSQRPITLNEVSAEDFSKLRRQFSKVKEQTIEEWTRLASSPEPLPLVEADFIERVGQEMQKVGGADSRNYSIPLIPEGLEVVAGRALDAALPSIFQKEHPEVDSVIRLSRVAQVGPQALVMYSRA